MMWGIVLVVVVVFTLCFLLSTDPPPILGVYSQPGKWYYLKYWVFYVLLKLRQRQNRKQGEVSGEGAGYGMRSRSTVEDMEKPQPLPSQHPEAVDAVYFNAANKQGYYLVAATARRQNNLVQTLLYLRVPDLGLLQLPSLPDTSLKATHDMTFSAGGLNISPIKPMKSWKLEFQGTLKLIKSEGEDTEDVQVSFSLDWNATTRYFDFDTDLDVFAMCDSMARETWTCDFFENLKQLHQTHYEQFGELSGEVHLGDYGTRQLKAAGVRDHSYGNVRNWAHLHRYAIQYVQLEDGSSICAGVICFPHTLSRITCGYVFTPDGNMHPIQSTDMQLHLVGEDGNDPGYVNFNFCAGGQRFTVEMEVVDCPIFYYGLEWEGRIHERFCTYKINGVSGWGISEWDYRNKTGKNVLFKRQSS